MVMILVDREEIYKEFRKDIMGGLNWEHILRTAKPYGLNIKENDMTPQKVSDILIHIIDGDWRIDATDTIEALKYAVKVVDKEISKTPYVLFFENRDQTQVFDVCPICGSPDIDKECGDYCPKCGQKLNWEEKDDRV